MCQFNHKCMLDKLCKDLIMSCIDVNNEVLLQSQSKNHTLSYWNDLVEHFKEKLLFWHCVWIDCGKPHEETVAHVMKTARARYHNVVKDIKKMKMNSVEKEWLRLLVLTNNTICGMR